MYLYPSSLQRRKDGLHGRNLSNVCMLSPRTCPTRSFYSNRMNGRDEIGRFERRSTNSNYFIVLRIVVCAFLEFGTRFVELLIYYLLNIEWAFSEFYRNRVPLFRQIRKFSREYWNRGRCSRVLTVAPFQKRMLKKNSISLGKKGALLQTLLRYTFSVFVVRVLLKIGMKKNYFPFC